MQKCRWSVPAKETPFFASLRHFIQLQLSLLTCTYTLYAYIGLDPEDGQTILHVWRSCPVELLSRLSNSSGLPLHFNLTQHDRGSCPCFQVVSFSRFYWDPTAWPFPKDKQVRSFCSFQDWLLHWVSGNHLNRGARRSLSSLFNKPCGSAWLECFLSLAGYCDLHSGCGSANCRVRKEIKGWWRITSRDSSCTYSRDDWDLIPSFFLFKFPAFGKKEDDYSSGGMNFWVAGWYWVMPTLHFSVLRRWRDTEPTVVNSASGVSIGEINSEAF